MKFRIANMTCGGCAKSVREAIASVDPHADVGFDMPNRVIEFETGENKHQFTLALASAGYPAVSI
ncbi:heavy-metal-associated domain-containing protein [Novosphingobium sp.]|uniref:heavy-metal-associated domain-containing protein n=1 Tax=Novosphingobium sp. TaxID=1874826 RepID=UPI00262B4565|nr:heavy-metal-associated domain-containing protein [Novosphingobium sp.]